MFSCGLKYIWYLQQQDGVCEIESKYTAVTRFIVVKEHVTWCNLSMGLNSFWMTVELSISN